MLVTAVIKREMKLAYRKPAVILNPVAFYVMVIIMFPMAVSPAPSTLQLIGPGVIWVTAMLANLLSLDNLFSHDYDDGTLEQLLMKRSQYLQIVYGKVIAHWISTMLPLVMLTPILGVMMHLSSASLGWLWLSLLIGTPTVTLIGAIGASLTVGLRKGSALVALMVLPLYIPTMLMGVGLTGNGAAGLNIIGVAAVLLALLIGALLLAPYAISAGLRIAIR
jgi:heme exporter protein B